MSTRKIINKKEYLKDFNTLLQLTIDRTILIDKKEYNKLLPLMYNLKTDITKVLKSFLELYVLHQEIKDLITFEGQYNFRYNKAFELIQQFTWHVCDDDYNILPLDQQNEKAKNWVHFDFSMKKPKTL